MNTTITKQECAELIDRLASKELTFGCLVLLGEDRREYRVLNQWNNYVGSEYITVWSEQLGKDVHQIGKSGEELGYKTEILGHDILIGDVLCRLSEGCATGGIPTKVYLERANELLRCWTPLCPSKSLQSILSEVEWESGYVHNGIFRPSECMVGVEAAKPSPATDLFTLLISLNLKK